MTIVHPLASRLLGAKPWIFLALLAAASLTSIPAAAATACWARCLKGPPCVAQTSEPIRENGSAFNDCTSIGPKEGKVQVRYRRNGVSFSAIAEPGHKVDAVLRQYPPDPCGLGDLKCQQEELNRRQGQQGAAGGHGADGRGGQPAGEGEPCLRGLPCDQILAPPGPWTIYLRDGGFEGTWLLRTIRSPQGEVLENHRLAVRRGRIDMPPGLLKAGALYGYQLLDAAGKPAASGEFRRVSSSEETFLRKSADKLINEGATPAEAWLDTLGTNRLQWNINQLLVSEGKLP